MPIVVRHPRLDTRQAESALLSTIAHAAESLCNVMFGAPPFAPMLLSAATQGSANPGPTIQALAARTADDLIAERTDAIAERCRDRRPPPVRRDLSPPDTFGVPRVGCARTRRPSSSPMFPRR